MRHNKKKDIIEGVLPANRRGAKRARTDLAQVHRNHRRSARQTMRTIRDAEDWLDDGAHGRNRSLKHGSIRGVSELTDDTNIAINHIKWQRRDADNLGALLHWANYQLNTKLADMCPTDQYHWFKRFLPDTMQGRHALSHINAEIDNWRHRVEQGTQRGQSWLSATAAERKARYIRAHAEVVAKLEELFRRGLHGEYNRRLKSASEAVVDTGGWTYTINYSFGYRDLRHWQHVDWGRVLEGQHDIENFAVHCLRNPRALALIDHLLEIY